MLMEDNKSKLTHSEDRNYLPREKSKHITVTERLHRKRRAVKNQNT